MDILNQEPKNIEKPYHTSHESRRIARTMLSILTGTGKFDLNKIIELIKYLRETVERDDYIKIIYGNKRMSKDNKYFLIEMENLDNHWCLKSQIDYQLNITGRLSRVDYERIVNEL